MLGLTTEYGFFFIRKNAFVEVHMLNYIRCGDYYIPDIHLPEESRPASSFIANLLTKSKARMLLPSSGYLFRNMSVTRLFPPTSSFRSCTLLSNVL